MKLFRDKNFDDVADQKLRMIDHEVADEPGDYLLRINEAEYIEHLVGKHQIRLLEVNWDGMEAEVEEKTVSLPRFGFTRRDQFDMERREVKRSVYTFHVPYTGEGEIFSYRPSSGLVWTTEIIVERDEFTFVIVDERDDGSVGAEAQDVIKKAKQQYESLRPELVRFNERVPLYVRQKVRARRDELLKRATIASSIGVPIRKSKSVPATFSIPAVKKKLVIERPKAGTTAIAPEPTLDRSLYLEILGMIHNSGVMMERHPSLYKNFETDKPRGEESLRDMFLMVLAPHFESATGEAFNKGGKTDILIKHEKSNVFVAECKFWGGAKLFHETIDQLFRYLTWRESKACLMMFVDNKELTPVLATIKKEAPTHPNFVKEKGQKKEGWMMYDFHLPGDKERPVEVAVMTFHFP